jgi:TatA/E family protein of Tat protein translocase
MFGIGMPEMILILAVALIVIGPKKLPDLAKSLGKAINEFRRATSDIKDSLYIGDDIDVLKTNAQEINKQSDSPAKGNTKPTPEKPGIEPESMPRGESAGQDKGSVIDG